MQIIRCLIVVLLSKNVIESPHLLAGFDVRRMLSIGERLFILTGKWEKEIKILGEIRKVNQNAVIYLSVIGRQHSEVRHDDESDFVTDDR